MNNTLFIDDNILLDMKKFLDYSGLTTYNNQVIAIISGATNTINELSAAVIDDEYVIAKHLNALNDSISGQTVIISGLTGAIEEKQDKLISGSNIKTINNQSLLTNGNLSLEDTTNKVNTISSSSTNTQYPTAMAVYTELSGTTISEEVEVVESDELAVTSVTYSVDKTSDTGTTFAIEPNKMYDFGVKTTLTISFIAGQPGIMNEYMFSFQSGSVAATLNVPASVTWAKTPNIQANKKYQVSILNNLGVIAEF